eukprot:TRINITY_DN15208_c0_g1_i1.p1 TRINITY_DN15208_c0_g1~~TRINITY_DN15208_c0_g1_i1.p1  ORF type:complete len:479 (+),score=46.76 TRINITY_DN15208_c0_g1_i1:43-1437(+)
MVLLCRKRDRPCDVNVGGLLFPTGFKAVSSCPALMSIAKRSRNGELFIDRNGKLYNYILPFLAEGRLVNLPTDSTTRSLLIREAEMLGLTDLIALLRAHVGAPVPVDEDARLLRLGSLLASRLDGDEDATRSIVRIMAAVHSAPMALATYVDRHLMVCISSVGFKHRAIPRSSSFCAHTLITDHSDRVFPFVVGDAREDPRFWNNPYVVGEPYIRTYSGVPLVTSDGFRVGALCTINDKPRQRTPASLQLLLNFGELASLEIERRQLSQAKLVLDDYSDSDMDMTDTDLDDAETVPRSLYMREAVNELVALVHIGNGVEDYRLLYANSLWCTTIGVNFFPPCDLRDNADAVGPGIPWPVDKPPRSGPTLWHWLRLEGETKAELDVRLREERRQLQRSVGIGSSVIIQGALRSARGTQSSRVSGRIVDATLPLNDFVPALEVENDGDTTTVSDDPLLVFVVMRLS